MARGNITIDRERCKGCELCQPVCPKQLIRTSAKLNDEGYLPAEFEDIAGADGCNACCLCAQICPDLAITVFREEKTG